MRFSRFVRHHLTTCDIILTGSDTASGRTYFLDYTDTGTDHGDVYFDRFRKVDGTWLIAHRQARTDSVAEGSPMAGALPHRRGG